LQKIFSNQLLSKFTLDTDAHVPEALGCADLEALAVGRPSAPAAGGVEGGEHVSTQFLCLGFLNLFFKFYDFFF
jgi:hypothetical protein